MVEVRWLLLSSGSPGEAFRPSLPKKIE